LTDLRKLAGRSIDVGNLASIEQTTEIRNGKFRECPKVALDFPIGFVGSNDFKSLIGILQSLNSSAISIWIRDTIAIGTLVIPTLNDIDFFSCFEVFGEVTTVITTDAEDRMLLVNDPDDKTETIELQGVNWSNAYDLYVGKIEALRHSAKGSVH
jgi:hypothetical protein